MRSTNGVDITLGAKMSQMGAVNRTPLQFFTLRFQQGRVEKTKNYFWDMSKFQVPV